MTPELERQLERCHNLPSLPGVALRILELGQDPEVDAGDVADLVGKDPAMAARLLRIANSPLYARRRRIGNLRQALMVLGLNATLSLALGFSLVGGLSQGRSMDYPMYWRRALITATTAQTLAMHFGVKPVEEFFLAGLLRDVGMLALDRALPQRYGSILDDLESISAIEAAERAALGDDHRRVGAWLLNRWGLTDALCSAAAGRAGDHAPEEVLDLVEIVDLSGYVADLWFCSDQQAVLDRLHQQVPEELDAEGIAAILTTVDGELQGLGEVFEVPMPTPAQREEILQGAQELLLVRNLRVLQEAAEMRQEADRLQARNMELETQAQQDPLTGLFNRRYMDRELDSEFANAREHGWPLTVVFLDLDHFKAVNDRHGHQVGDQVLIAVARCLKEHARQSDLVCRYGGEEFVVGLPGASAQAGAQMAQRMLGFIAALAVPLDNGEAVAITASAGVAEVSGEALLQEQVELLLRNADRALYMAKLAGRNCVRVYGQEDSAGD